MEKLNQILKDYVAVGGETKDKVLGATFVVVNEDAILYTGASGRIDGPADSPAFTSDSLVWIASMSKIITATSLMQLVEKGLIELDGDVRPLVPELAKAQILRGFDQAGKPILEDNTKPMTLRQLLTHTSGMGYDMIDPDIEKWSHAVGRTIRNLVFTLDGWNTPLKFLPGERWQYGSGLDWAGQVLEKVTGKGLGEYMSENIFKPLGMTDTTFRRQAIAERMQGRIAPCSYRNAESGDLNVGPFPVPEDPPVESGGAGLYTTARDYVKFLQALLAACHGKESILRKETVDEMFRPQINDAQCLLMKLMTDGATTLPPETAVNHGISGLINTEDVAGKRRKGSMAWAGYTNCNWWIDHKTGIAATLFVNVIPQPDSLVNKLYDELELAVYQDLLPSLQK